MTKKRKQSHFAKSSLSRVTEYVVTGVPRISQIFVKLGLQVFIITVSNYLISTFKFQFKLKTASTFHLDKVSICSSLRQP